MSSYVLIGPQGIGKSRHAAALCKALGCSMFTDNWDGKTDHKIALLYITSDQTDPINVPAGAKVIEVESEKDILNLIETSGESSSLAH